MVFALAGDSTTTRLRANGDPLFIVGGWGGSGECCRSPVSPVKAGRASRIPDDRTPRRPQSPSGRGALGRRAWVRLVGNVRLLRGLGGQGPPPEAGRGPQGPGHTGGGHPRTQ